MIPESWSTADFEAMSWHDCHVHGLRLAGGAFGAGELELDLDYLAEWRCGGADASFVIVPCSLRFHEVAALRIALDWAAGSAALGPFALAGIERRVEQRPRYTATLWRLAVSWPAGSIEFESSGFTQTPWGRAVESRNQCLEPRERVGAL